MKKGYSFSDRAIPSLSGVEIGRIYSEALLYNNKRLMQLCGQNLKGKMSDPLKIILTGLILIVLLADNVTGQISPVGFNSAHVSNASTIVLTKPSGVVAGDIMIVTITKNKNADVSSTGWDAIQATLGGNSSRRAAVLYRVANEGDSGVSSYTFNIGNNSDACGVIMAYTGVNGFDVTPGTITATSTTSKVVNPTSITTETPGALVIMLGMSYTGGSTPFRTFENWSLTSPELILNEYYDYGNSIYSVGAATRIQACPGPTSDGTITVSGNAYLGGIILALKPRVDTWWNGSNGTDWNDGLNWSNGIPGSTSKVLVPLCSTNQPVVSASGTANCNSLLIETGASLTVEPTAQMTVTTSLTNNGTLNLESDATGTASLMVGSYSGNDANIELFLSSDYWHYISSPIGGLSVNEFSAGNDLAQFIESLPQNDPPDWQRGWFAWDGWSYAYDGEVYDPADYRFGSMYAFNSLELGKGYNYWNVSDHTFTLSGQINTTDPSPSISYSGDETWSGYNLLGNPYSCGINIQTMFNDASWPSTALKSVYYTWGDVAYTVSDGGLSVPGGASLSIPPMQGFFVKATGTGNIPFLESARQHNSTPRYKGELSASIPLVRLSINKNGKSGETVVRFNERATAGLDIDFDAPKFMDSPGLPSIYTSLDGKDFTINGIPFPETSVEIPITVKLLTDGNHVITAMEIQELANYKLSLKDKSTGSTVDLKSFKDYSFSAPAGEIKDRFILTVTSNLSTTIEDPVSVDNEFNIYSGFDLINIQPLSDQWDGKNGSVRLMDISGKTVRNQPNTEFTKNALIQLPSPGNGIYFIEIRSGIMRYVGKVVVK